MRSKATAKLESCATEKVADGIACQDDQETLEQGEIAVASTKRHDTT